jgi:hypothetical protein
MNNKILLTGLVLASLATGNVFAQGSNIGIGNTSNGDNGFVLGVENQADSTATSSFTAGYKNHTSGANTLTAGHSNIISNANNLTVGTKNTVSGTSSLVSGHKNTNKSNNSLVIGMNNTIEQSAENSLVNGEKHNVSARSSSVSGYENKVDGQYNNVSGYGNIIKENASGVQVSGYGNEVSAKNVLVSGTSNKAHGENAFVGGENAQALGRNTFVFGSNAQANQDYTVAIGTQAISSAHDTITIGNGSEANGVSSVVLGRTNKVNADNTVVVGANNGEIKSAQSAVFGYNNTVKGEKPEQLIFGSNSTTNNQGAIVVGTHGQAIAQDAVAIGNNTLADVQNSVALGTNSTTEEAVSTDSIYINGEKYNFAGAVANSAVSIGANGKAGFSGVQNYKRTLTNVAAGRIDDTSTDAINGSQLNAVINALKFTTVVDGTNTTVTETKNIDGGKEFAVHVNKDLTNMNSVQFNNGVAINNNGINAGNKTITNVTAGQNDTDAVNVSQLNNAKDQLTGRINGLDQRVTANANDIHTAEHTILDHEGRITVLESDVKDLDNKINSTAGNVLNQSKSYTDNQAAKVGANAAALSALHPLDFNADEKWQFSVGFGNYKGKNATALGAFYQPNENVLLSVGTTLGTGENMINAGATVRFGSHSSMTTNKQVAVAKEVQDLKLQLSAISQKYDNLVKNLSAQKAGQDVDFEYSDLPKDHWAYDFVKKLSDKGYLNGYPDGTFKGDAKMTRYEFAAALWRAVNNGAIIDSQMAKAIKEFEPELEEVNKIMRYRIDTVAGKDNSVHKTERLRVNKNDDPFTHMKRDDYGTKTYTNK